MPKNTQDVLEAQVDPMTIISQLMQQMQTDRRQAEEDRKLMMSTIADIMKTVKDNQLTPSSSTTIVSGPDNDFYQLKKDLPQFTFNEEEGQTFEYWFRRYSPAIRDRGMVLPEDKKRDLIIEKLDEVAYRGYAEDILPSVPQDFGYDETVEKLKKLFGPKKTLIRRRFECLKIMCPPASETYMPFRDFANSVKRMTENAQLKELDYEGLKTLLFIAGLQDSTLSDVRLRMLAKLDSYAGSTPLTIDSLVSECENFMTLKVDNRDMGAANINAVRRRRNSYKQYRKPFEPNRQVSSDIRCFDCSKRHRWNNCPLKAHTHHDVKDSNKSAIPKRQQRTRGFRCKNVKLPNVVDSHYLFYSLESVLDLRVTLG